MKFIKSLIFILVMFTLPMANASTTMTTYSFGTMRTVVINWTAETDGSFITAETNAINGVVGWVETNPGTTAPTANYDITLKNQDGYDIMGGKLSDRSATVTEGTTPYDPDNSVHLTCPVRGPLSIAITNNSVNAATGSITIYYWLQ